MTQPSNGPDATLVLTVGADPEDGLPLVKEALEGEPAAAEARWILLDPTLSEDVRALAQKRGLPAPFPLPRPCTAAAALNLVLRAVDTPYVAVLSTDCVPGPGWLDRSLERVRTRPSLAFVASRMIFYYTPTLLHSAGVAVDRSFDATLRGFRQPMGACEHPVPVLAPSRRAALYRRSLFQEAGFFDESMTELYGDADLGLRALLLGLEGAYAPDAICFDRRPPPVSMDELREAYAATQRDRAALLYKNVPMGFLLRSLPRHLGAALRRLVHAWRRRQLGPFLEGRLRFWRDLFPLMRHRRRLHLDPRVRFERLVDPRLPA